MNPRNIYMVEQTTTITNTTSIIKTLRIAQKMVKSVDFTIFYSAGILNEACSKELLTYVIINTIIIPEYMLIY